MTVRAVRLLITFLTVALVALRKSTASSTPSSGLMTARSSSSGPSATAAGVCSSVPTRAIPISCLSHRSPSCTTPAHACTRLLRVEFARRHGRHCLGGCNPRASNFPEMPSPTPPSRASASRSSPCCFSHSSPTPRASISRPRPINTGVPSCELIANDPSLGPHSSRPAPTASTAAAAPPPDFCLRFSTPNSSV